MTASKGYHKGRWGEAQVASFLQNKGYEIMEQNFRPSRWQGEGEIDLLVRKGRLCWVVEVKTRSQQSARVYGLLRESQRRRLYSAAWAVGRERTGLRMGVLLVWLDAQTGRMEFLENP